MKKQGWKQNIRGAAAAAEQFKIIYTSPYYCKGSSVTCNIRGADSSLGRIGRGYRENATLASRPTMQAKRMPKPIKAQWRQPASLLLPFLAV